VARIAAPRLPGPFRSRKFLPQKTSTPHLSGVGVRGSVDSAVNGFDADATQTEKAGSALADLKAASVVSGMVDRHLSLAISAQPPYQLATLQRVPNQQLEQLGEASRALEAVGISVLGFVDPRLASGAKRSSELARLRGQPGTRTDEPPEHHAERA
jgi:hypothetical protein